MTRGSTGVVRHPSVPPELIARAELEQAKLRAQVALAAAGFDDGAARYLAQKLLRLGRRVRVDVFARAAA